MMPMHASRRVVRNTLIAVVLLVGIIGPLYAYIQSIPAGIACPLVAAFMLEAALYVVPGFEAARQALEQRFRTPLVALWMTLSGVVPYLVYAAPTGVFDWTSFGELAALAAAVSFWYVVLPRNPAANLAFVALMAAGLLGPLFPHIYATPVPRLPLFILGQLMWTRLGILSTLSVAHMDVKGFGFLPTRKEWVAGVRNFVWFAPAGILLGWLVDFAHFQPRPMPVWQTLAVAGATFLGMFWVVALREEFFFRGLLQEWVSGWLKSAWAGLILTAVLFGLVHLPFRSFPNWRFAALATLAGFFYGRAYLEGRSVRAAMVTHALVNTTWRVLFP